MPTMTVCAAASVVRSDTLASHAFGAVEIGAGTAEISFDGCVESPRALNATTRYR